MSLWVFLVVKGLASTFLNIMRLLTHIRWKTQPTVKNSNYDGESNIKVLS